MPPRRSAADRVAGIYTDVYTWYMAMRAKLFQNGGSQAVRLPKECRFSDEPSEVLVEREGRRVILEPLDQWSAEFVEILGAWSWSEPLERPRQLAVGELGDPFR